MRRKLQSRERAKLLAMSVLPMPGTSSSRTCPWQSRATNRRSIASALPTITLPTFSRRRAAAPATAAASCALSRPRASLNRCSLRVALSLAHDARRTGAATMTDVVVAGAGNAALCAALSAREQGAEVVVLEKAPEHLRGGNTYFTGGGFRFAFDSYAD